MIVMYGRGYGRGYGNESQSRVWGREYDLVYLVESMVGCTVDIYIYTYIYISGVHKSEVSIGSYGRDIWSGVRYRSMVAYTVGSTAGSICNGNTWYGSNDSGIMVGCTVYMYGQEYMSGYMVGIIQKSGVRSVLRVGCHFKPIWVMFGNAWYRVYGHSKYGTAEYC